MLETLHVQGATLRHIQKLRFGRCDQMSDVKIRIILESYQIAPNSLSNS